MRDFRPLVPRHLPLHVGEAHACPEVSNDHVSVFSIKHSKSEVLHV